MFFTHSAQAIEQNRQFYTNMYDPDHPLVLFDTVIDWSAILQTVLPYYSMSPTGRPLPKFRIVFSNSVCTNWQRY